jgi:nucleoside-diphosphate-sugar epimerase
MNLVTGGTGLVGAHLLLQLAQNGESVRALYRSKSTIKKTENLFIKNKATSLFSFIEWMQGDVTDIPSLEIAFQGITHVYHCAAFISFDPKEEEKLRKTNIEGTTNMVNCSLAFGIEKFCHVSSIAALGDLTKKEESITEETEWNPEKPHSDYAISKFGAEMELWRAKEEGLNCICVNPGVILGTVSKKSDWSTGSSEIYQRIANGMPFYANGSTGFITIDDVIKTMIFLMKSAVCGERFTLITENVNYKDLICWVADTLEVKKPTFLVKPWMTAIAWRLDWFFTLILPKKRSLSRAMSKSMHSSEHYSNAKITAILPFSFQSIQEHCSKIDD